MNLKEFNEKYVVYILGGYQLPTILTDNGGLTFVDAKEPIHVGRNRVVVADKTTHVGVYSETIIEGHVEEKDILESIVEKFNIQS